MVNPLRDLKLAEFNRLLPMARESIKRKLHILEKEQEKKNLEVLLEQRQKEIDYCNKMIEFMSEFQNLDSDTSSAFENLRIKLENSIVNYKKEKSEFKSSIDLIRDHIFQNEDIFELETSLFETIISQLSCCKGFLNEDDINEEYIEEYIYLWILNYTGRKTLTTEKPLSFNVSKLVSLCNLSDVKKDALLTQLNNQSTSTAVFFSIFYDKDI